MTPKHALNPTEHSIESFIYRTLREFGLDGWTVVWTEKKGEAGCCWYSKQQIDMSRAIMRGVTYEDTFDTAIHETAHAIVGPDANHGPKWRAMYEALGGKKTVSHIERSSIDVEKVGFTYIGTCPNGHKRGRSRMVTSPRSCDVCDPVFNRDFMITWIDTRTGKDATYAKKPVRRKRSNTRFFAI